MELDLSTLPDLDLSDLEELDLEALDAELDALSEALANDPDLIALMGGG
jgi:hypothetical protein